MLDRILHYTPTVINDNDNDDIKRENRYVDYVNKIIPKTSEIIYIIKNSLNKEYNTEKNKIGETKNIYSNHAFIEFLEPFLIYSEHINYKEYEKIAAFVHYQSIQYNKKYVEQSKSFGILDKYRNNAVITSYNLFPSIFALKSTNKREIVVDEYHLLKMIQIIGEESKTKNSSKDSHVYTNSMILTKIIQEDDAFFYTSCLAYQDIDLIVPVNMDSLYENKIDDIKTDNKKTDECKTIIIAKIYDSESSLMDDNGHTIYFDKKYDTTNYEILEEYEKELNTMHSDVFLPFLVKKMETRFQLQPKEAMYFVETLLNGIKKVVDGQYAILFTTDFQYYKREKERWIKQDNKGLPPFGQGIETDQTDILCNIQNKCVAEISNTINKSDQCETIKKNQMNIKTELIKNIIHEFDNKYQFSITELKRKRINNYEISKFRLPILHHIHFLRTFQYNIQKWKIIRMNKKAGDDQSELIISPYVTIRDMILGQTDFVKKQQDILEFVRICTRTAYTHIEIGPRGEKEDDHWLYCTQTDTKLLPEFIYSLASIYIETPELYDEKIWLIIQKIGKLSEDGDMWIDGYSGYPIKPIDYVTDECFDESGFRIVSRAIMEDEDFAVSKAEAVDDNSSSSDSENQISKEYEPISDDSNPAVKIIRNIIVHLSVTMGINIEKDKNKIIKITLELLTPILQKQNREQYEKYALIQANKGKTVLSYDDYYSTNVLYLTLGVYFVCIQTAIPSIKTRKTFPNCVRSFAGYPLEGVGDYSGINYLTCVCIGVRNAIVPWNVLQKKKKELISEQIRKTIETYILPNADIDYLIKRKVEYLVESSLSTDEVISEEYAVQKWTNFLPALVKFQLKPGVEPISNEFKKELVEDLKRGKNNQLNKELIIQSKIVQYSFGIQEKIQEIVHVQDVLLHKMTNEPFLENACCIGNSPEQTTIQYFIQKKPDIKSMNEIVKGYSNIIFDLNQYAKAATIWSNINNKNIYTLLPIDFGKKTILLAFIRFCHFKTDVPIPIDLLPLCNSKPIIISQNDDLNQIISKLKSEGIDFTHDQFIRLLQITSRKSMSHLKDINSDYEKIYRPITMFGNKINAILENNLIFNVSLKKPDKSDKYEKKEIIKKIKEVIDASDKRDQNESLEEIRSLNNLLLTLVPTLKKRIIEFININKNGQMKAVEIRKITSFIEGLKDWNTTDDEKEKYPYKAVLFSKTMIHNLVNIFPTLILNKVGFKSNMIPKHWDLSTYHQKDIREIISEYYLPLSSFYGNIVLEKLLGTLSQIDQVWIEISKSTPVNKKTLNDPYPLFDERTSAYLFEYYIIQILIDYIDLTEDADLDIRKIKSPIKKILNDPTEIITVDYHNDVIDQRNINEKIEEDPLGSMGTSVIFQGNKKLLKQNTAHLLYTFLEMMNNEKEFINISYGQIQDRVFKIQEKEKFTITDRYQLMNDEDRNVEKVFQKLKLGIWGKGLQKSLISYDKNDYDQQREFTEKMKTYENEIAKKGLDMTPEEYEQYLRNENEFDHDAYDMSNENEDEFFNGNPYGDEPIENPEDYL
jgi:hypothetical protein